MKIKYNHQEVAMIIEEGCLHSLSHYLDSKKKYLLITDENVNALYAHYYEKIDNVTPYIIKPGEASKDIFVSTLIIKSLLDNNFDKGDVIIAFGGGVVGDLSGFIASIYKRGIDYINVPTTLIAQVDSAIGGKVAVNFEGYKNQIGSIYHPKLILVDPLVLSSLPQQEYLSGLGEILKYGALFDQNLFCKLENKDYNLLEVIKRCIELKIAVVMDDEFDQGKRQLLNFGHTIGHAIEAKYQIPHGISIGYGMYLESKNQRIKEVLQSFGFDFNTKFTNLDYYIKKDKKIKAGKLTMIRLKDIGAAELEEGDINEYLCK